MFSPVQIGSEGPVAQPGSSFIGDTIMDDEVLGWFALG